MDLTSEQKIFSVFTSINPAIHDQYHKEFAEAWQTADLKTRETMMTNVSNIKLGPYMTEKSREFYEDFFLNYYWSLFNPDATVMANIVSITALLHNNRCAPDLKKQILDYCETHMASLTCDQKWDLYKVLPHNTPQWKALYDHYNPIITPADWAYDYNVDPYERNSPRDSDDSSYDSQDSD